MEHKIEILTSLINIFDPIGLYEICPDDEYKSEIERIDNLARNKNFAQIESFVKSLYPMMSEIEPKKIKELIKAIRLLYEE